MTKEQFTKRFHSLQATTTALIKERADALLESGTINLDDYGDDYELPKIILTASLEAATDKFRPLTPKGRNQVANLRHF